MIIAYTWMQKGKFSIVTWRLKARIVEREETAIASQRLGEHAPAATDAHATMEELVDAVFSMRSVPRQYSEDH
jgi:hypothetical protein